MNDNQNHIAIKRQNEESNKGWSKYKIEGYMVYGKPLSLKKPTFKIQKGYTLKQNRGFAEILNFI